MTKPTETTIRNPKFKDEPAHLAFKDRIEKLYEDGQVLFDKDTGLMNAICSLMHRVERLTGRLYDV